MTPVLVAATLAAAAGLVLAGDRPARYWTKPLASLGFLAVAMSAGALDTRFGRLLFVGLVLGAIGDVILLWSAQAPFLAGLTAFLLGHLAYVAAFASRSSAPAIIAGVAVAVAVGLVSWRWLRPHVSGVMRRPVAGYVVVISAMLMTAIGAVEAAPLATSGAVLFVVSDLAVARERFVTPNTWNPRVGLSLYYLGQVLIALAAGAA